MQKPPSPSLQSENAGQPPKKEKAALRTMEGSRDRRRVSFDMPLADAMSTQRAIRRVTDEPVSDELVLRLIELGTKAPNAENRQRWEFIVVRDRRVKERLGRLNRFMWRLAGPALRKKAAKDPDHAKVLDATEWGVDHFEEYPVLIVACFRGSRLAWPPILGASVYGSLMPAVQNILLAARATGLGANLTTMPLWSNLLARLALGIPWSITPAVVITLGWPQGRYGPANRKPVGYVVSLDRYDKRPWFGQTVEQAFVKPPRSG